MEKAEQKSWSFVSEATFIAAVSGITYLAAYKYEEGYCQFWGLPNEFIEVPFERLATLAFITISFFLAWLFPVMTLGRSLFITKLHSPLLRMMIIPLVVTCVFVGLLLVYPTLRPAWWLIAGVVLIFWVMQFGLSAWIAHREKITFWDAENQTREADRQVVTPFDWIVGNFGEMGWPLILLLLLSISAAPMAGFMRARGQKTFPALIRESATAGDSCQALIVIKRYSGQLFCVSADTCAHSFKRGVILLTLEQLSSDNVTIREIYTGALEKRKVVPGPSSVLDADSLQIDQQLDTAIEKPSVSPSP